MVSEPSEKSQDSQAFSSTSGERLQSNHPDATSQRLSIGHRPGDLILTQPWSPNVTSSTSPFTYLRDSLEALSELH